MRGGGAPDLDCSIDADQEFGAGGQADVPKSTGTYLHAGAGRSLRGREGDNRSPGCDLAWRWGLKFPQHSESVSSKVNISK